MSSIRDFYHNRYANMTPGSPDSEDERTFHLRVGTALAAIGDHPLRLLDFGCGRGGTSKRFAEAGHQVVGVDISAPAIALARAKVPTATFEVIDSENRIPLPDEAFDVCFCSEVIEHLFDIDGFVHEIHRLLVQNGLFLLTTPYHGWLKNLLIITFGFETHFNPAGGHIRFFSERSLVRCLEAGGFRVERIAGLGRFWPLWKTMFVVARKRA